MTKKTFKIFIIIVSIISLFLLGKIIYSNSLKGEKIDDFIYNYHINGKKDTYIPIEINDDNIYYLKEEKEKTYTLYKRNIKNKENVNMGTIDGEYDYCTFENNYIFCSSTNNDYYDYNLKLLYSKTNKEDNSCIIIYYQNKFLDLVGNKVYENDKLIKELKFDSNKAHFSSDIVIGNNTYLSFLLMDEGTYLYYDMLNDKYETQKETLWSRYNNGVYSIIEGKIATYNLLTNKYNEYKDLILSEFTTASTLYDDVFYFMENDYLYTLDLNTKQIGRIEHKFDKQINLMYYDNNYIYLISNIDNLDVDIYVVDINKVNKTVYENKEFKNYMNNYVDTKVKELEDKYHVDIVYKNDAKMENKTFKTTVLDNDFVIVSALDNIEKVLKKFNTEFFDTFKDDKHKGLIIYLTGEIIAQYGVDTIPNPSGYTLSDNDQFEIVLDARGNSTYSTMCHELMHATDNRMETNLYIEWFKKNPTNFDYAHSYTDSITDKYTMFEKDKNNVYFIDTYAKTYPGEDIARIFENICDREDSTFISEYPHLLDKALYLKETMEKEFPSLKKATVFNSLKTK